MKLDKNILDSKAGFIIFLAIILFLASYQPPILPAILGVVVVAVKAGLGCRYGTVSRETILSLSLIYFAIATVLGFLLDNLLPLLTQLLNYTLLFHLAISLALILAGYKTIRSFSCGLDVSNKTFLAIAIPCPVCFGATMISCYFVAEILKMSGLLVGLKVGAIIALGIVAISIGRRANPEKLGKIMILLGVYYIFSMLLIPAVIQGMKLEHKVSIDFSPYSLLLLFVFALGFVRGVREYD